MDCPLPHTVDAVALVSVRLGELGDALDGYPVAVLVDACLQHGEQAGAIDRRAAALGEHILAQWARTIDRDLAQFPAASMDVLLAIRQRMVRSRDALLAVQSLMHHLGECEAPPARAERGLHAPVPA